MFLSYRYLDYYLVLPMFYLMIPLLKQVDYL
nr:MAG TPA: hypothetical protein [Caudoviricetes sp.]